MDTLTPKERSERMGRVRNKDTKPEMVVRRLVHSLGYRYRLHSRKLPGHPDMIFPGRGKVIFVHGCFWHRHDLSCPFTRMPKSRLDFWAPKFEATRRRDAEKQASLREMGWECLVLWECELKDLSSLADRIRKFLE
jgi:DNA mismatch endonuclease, patch repair protein